MSDAGDDFARPELDLYRYGGAALDGLPLDGGAAGAAALPTDAAKKDDLLYGFRYDPREYHDLGDMRSVAADLAVSASAGLAVDASALGLVPGLAAPALDGAPLGPAPELELLGPAAELELMSRPATGSPLDAARVAQLLDETAGRPGPHGLSAPGSVVAVDAVPARPYPRSASLPAGPPPPQDYMQTLVLGPGDAPGRRRSTPAASAAAAKADKRLANDSDLNRHYSEMTSFQIPESRPRKKSKYSSEQDELILSLKRAGHSWPEIAQAANCENFLAARNRYQVLIGQQGSGNVVWDAEDEAALRALLDEGEKVKWKFISSELSKLRNKRMTPASCQRKMVELEAECGPSRPALMDD
ncbi:uncharacterized protein V1510DRAFT_409108 [Dipodascopsis tothii]|uniref:uncharacterized protein n=1 Tax=Dipodascopsis tothii TaxID=44089 RepID=UPI0034CE415F